MDKSSDGTRARGSVAVCAEKIMNEIWMQVETAYASGIGLREIARSMGISEGTVLSRAKREGWTREIQNAKALVKREDAVLATPVESGRHVDGGTRRAPS